MGQRIQGHDIIPKALFRPLGGVIQNWLPGWSGSVVYNFDARASSQMAAAQLDILLHSGPHKWLNDSMRPLHNSVIPWTI